jgi:hypothetical protein
LLLITSGKGSLKFNGEWFLSYLHPLLPLLSSSTFILFKVPVKAASLQQHFWIRIFCHLAHFEGLDQSYITHSHKQYPITNTHPLSLFLWCCSKVVSWYLSEKEDFCQSCKRIKSDRPVSEKVAPAAIALSVAVWPPNTMWPTHDLTSTKYRALFRPQSGQPHFLQYFYSNISNKPLDISGVFRK